MNLKPVKLYDTLNENDREVFRKWLGSHLLLGPVDLTFTKKDGTIREMKATLKPGVVPEVNSDGTRKSSSNVVSVWDLEKNAWRSVRYESIKTVKFTTE